MKNVIIFGADQFAEIIYEFLKNDNNMKICAFTVDEKYKNVSEYRGLPLVAFENVEKIYPPEQYDIMICLGYTNMNNVRKEKYRQAREKGYKVVGYRHPSAIVLTEDYDESSIIMEGVVIGQGCKIGEGNVFWPKAHIAHHTTVGNYNFFTISCAVAGNIEIHDNCVFGNNCTIKNGIDIASYTLVGAGAYISKSTEECAVYVPPRTYKLEGKTSFDFKL